MQIFDAETNHLLSSIGRQGQIRPGRMEGPEGVVFIDGRREVRSQTMQSLTSPASWFSSWSTSYAVRYYLPRWNVFPLLQLNLDIIIGFNGENCLPA